MANVQSTAISIGEVAARLEREAQALCSRIVAECSEASGALESPIEQVFHAAWSLLERFDNDPEYRTCITSQVEVIRYRLDFAIQANDICENLSINVAVEVDGHEFHERTKAQVAYRNQRDRELQAAGWKVFHFSGSEVWAHPVKCASEVRDYCKEELGRMYIARRAAIRGQS